MGDLIEKPKFKPFNSGLREALESYRDRNELSLSDLARQLGTNPTQVSKYLGGKPEGDVDKLEGLIADVIKNESRRRAANNELFPTSISRQLAGDLETIQETNDFALVSGPAGIGKSCGIELYVRDHPAAVAVTVKVWTRNPNDIEGLVFHAVANSGWRGNQKRSDFLVSKLRGSKRLIIVDNAHKLTPRGLEWLFDFHDSTDCPVGLIGNPEILERIKKNDQMFSRIGLFESLTLAKGQALAIARRMIAQLIPTAGDDLDGVAEAVAENQGHFRAVKKELLLARKIRENSKGELPWETAVKAAHTQLVRSYAI